MTGFRAFASNSPPPPPTPGERILLCALNWIGDGIMSMPAVQALRAACPEAAIELLIKPGLTPLWALHEAPDALHLLTGGARGLAAAARILRGRRFSRAYVLPHSTRSALAPFLAGIPLRIGTTGGVRDMLLTHVRRPPDTPERRHQAWEYLRLFDLDAPNAVLERPRLKLPPSATCAADALLSGLPRPVFGVMPGAARGPSKRWPQESFAELARRLIRETSGSVAVMGTPSEAGLCAPIADAAGARGRNLTGKTDLATWAASLQACDGLVANDSGGMHLAAALGVPLVALFGLTDPDRTGPISMHAVILQAESTRRSRDIARRDTRATGALAALSVNAVLFACLRQLSDSSRGRIGS